MSVERFSRRMAAEAAMVASAAPSEEDIIRRVVDGEVDLFEALLIRHREHVGKIVAGHVPRDMVEEVTHDVFVRAYISLPTYSFRTPFGHWLSTVAIRACYDAWRTHSARKEIPLSEWTGPTDDQQQWVERVLAADSIERFEAISRQHEATEVLSLALAQLSPENRMVVTLMYLEGRSVREAAELLGWSIVNVKVRAHRARRQLRAILETLLKDAP